MICNPTIACRPVDIPVIERIMMRLYLMTRDEQWAESASRLRELPSWADRIERQREGWRNEL